MASMRQAAATNTSDDLQATAVFDAAPVAMLIVESDGRVVMANDELERTFGRPRAAVVGTSIEKLIAPDDRAALRAELARVIASPDARSRRRHEVNGLDERGKPFAIEVSLGKLDAPVGSAVAVVRDLRTRRSATTQLAMESSAHEARERLVAMLECAPAFLLALNRLGTIDFINRTLPQYVKEDVIGQYWLSFFPPDQHAVLESKLQQMYDTETAQVYEATTAGPDGRPVCFETQVAPMWRDGKVVGCVLVAQDVTERKLAQAELLSNRHMALLGTLAAGIAHEINTPIQFVRDSLDFLSDAATSLLSLLDILSRLRQDAVAGKPLAPVVEAAAVAESEVDLPFLRENLEPAFQRSLDGLNKIAKIVRSLKDFAHPSQDEVAPADLNRVIQDALTIATNEYRYVADLETHYGELPPIWCHSAEISQVVLNIVVNAAHAIADVVDGSEGRGLITVSTRYEDNAAIIRISDTGGGIPPAIQARIFDPFFTTKEVGKGTGQGLAIAGSMVRERHGGKLTFETEVGKGTTFVIQLPNMTPTT